jgi:hypothetical protein
VLVRAVLLLVVAAPFERHVPPRGLVAPVQGTHTWSTHGRMQV